MSSNVAPSALELGKPRMLGYQMNKRGVHLKWFSSAHTALASREELPSMFIDAAGRHGMTNGRCQAHCAPA